MLLKWIARRWRPPEAAGDALRAARALREEGDIDAAREACLQVLRDEPDDANAMALMAALAADQRHIDNGLQWAQRALALQRDCVAAHFARGRLLEAAERYPEAEAAYREVVRLDPSNAGGHTNLGCMLHWQDRFDEAAACYRRALQLEPGQPEALRNFALIAGGAEEAREARQGFEHHVAAHPHDADAHQQLAHLHLYLGEYAQALEAYERSIALEPQRADFHYSYAQMLLLLGRYQEGWSEYEWRWRIPALSGAMQRFAQPRWDGSPLAGTLLVHSEPGFGDMLQLLRYLPMAAARCGRVVVECRPAIASLVARIEGVAQVVREGEPLPPFDAHLPPIAFPRVFGTTLETIPWRGAYVVPDPARVAPWADRVAAAAPRKRKVGLVWTGDPGNRSNRDRSVTLPQLAALAQANDTSFFSLQKGGEPATGDVPGQMHFIDLTSELRDFSDTAALVAQLDLVISVDTSVAHLAGAMDRPTWVLLPFSAEWRHHVDRGHSPWYPRTKLFRQDSPGEWSGVLRRLGDELARWARQES